LLYLQPPLHYARRVRIALAQLDCRLGEVAANAARARETLAEAARAGADLVVFPELQLTGYAVGRVEHETACTASELLGLVPPDHPPSMLLGFRERDGDRTYNSAAYVEGGALVHVHRKLYLPHYGAFEEADAFTPGDSLRAFDTALGRTAVLICNDAWQPVVPFLAVHDGARVLLLPSNSSDAMPEAEAYWRELTRFYARMLECYVVFVNRVGDEAGVTFWGGSHVVGPRGEIVGEAPRLEESLLLVDVDLERVAARRRDVPLLAGPRLDLLAAELERISEVPTHH
jgi:predicted amidohydrolase